MNFSQNNCTGDFCSLEEAWNSTNILNNESVINDDYFTSSSNLNNNRNNNNRNNNNRNNNNRNNNNRNNNNIK